MTPESTGNDPLEGVFRNLVSGYLKAVESDVRFAFHPVVSDSTEGVTGFEALVRGEDSVTADSINRQVSPENRFAFDQACRILAIRAAGQFEIEGNLHLNCTQVSAQNAELVSTVTGKIARQNGFESNRIVLELSNLEEMQNFEDLGQIRKIFKQAGFQVLFDNFGRHDSDPDRLEHLAPDWVKFDRALIENIQDRTGAQETVRKYLDICRKQHIQPMAAGIERGEELKWLRDEGVVNFQGYYFSPPEMDQEQVFRPN